MSQFLVMAISAIFSSNIVSVVGVGAVSLQSEKRNFVYMLISSLCYMMSVVVAGLLYYVIDQYLLVPFKVEYLKLFIVVLFSIVLALICKSILKHTSKEVYYLYEKSYSAPVQTAVCAGTLLIVDYAVSFLDLMFSLAMYCVGFLLVQIIFYALYERLDNSYTLKPARNVPLMLFTLSIVSMILYVVQMFF